MNEREKIGTKVKNVFNLFFNFLDLSGGEFTYCIYISYISFIDVHRGSCFCSTSIRYTAVGQIDKIVRQKDTRAIQVPLLADTIFEQIDIIDRYHSYIVKQIDRYHSQTREILSLDKYYGNRQYIPQ